LRLVVQLQDGHFPSVVGHIKVMVCYPVLNELCMHRSPAPLQRSIDKSMISCDYWSLQHDHNGAPCKFCLQAMTLSKHTLQQLLPYMCMHKKTYADHDAVQLACECA